jgi:hypothetical protein
MKPFLMYRDRDFGQKEDLLPNAADLTQDLDLNTLFEAMSGEDRFLFEVAKKSILASLREPETILYRQHVLADCLNLPETVREIYSIAMEAIDREKKVWGWMSRTYAEGTLKRSIEVLHIFLQLLKRLRQIAEQQGARFCSEGFTRLFEMLARELDDEYLRRFEEHLRQLTFDNGILMSAELGKGNKGVNCVLHKQPDEKRSWIERFQGWLDQVTGRNDYRYVYEIADRDEAGFRALTELSGRGICSVATALAQSSDHILSFFGMLRLELGFYIGCLNLRDRLAQKREPICIPEPLAVGRPLFSCKGLYDICLTLNMDDKVVGNDVAADDKALVMITGANRGGKSTFLRSAGIAQLMMQCGMFVPAGFFRANVCCGIFTHFKREEDATMKSGKLDEELSRMSSIIDKAAPGSFVLLNESFSSTNEREGSEIARQIVRALLETEVKVFYVTHMFDLAHRFYAAGMKDAVFLRAKRLTDGRRTFRLVEGEPLPTSYGEDLYRRIFGVPHNGLMKLPRDKRAEQL